MKWRNLGGVNLKDKKCLRRANINSDAIIYLLKRHFRNNLYALFKRISITTRHNVKKSTLIGEKITKINKIKRKIKNFFYKQMNHMKMVATLKRKAREWKLRFFEFIFNRLYFIMNFCNIMLNMLECLIQIIIMKCMRKCLIQFCFNLLILRSFCGFLFFNLNSLDGNNPFLSLFDGWLWF